MRLDAKCRSHFEPTEAPELGGTTRSCGDGGEAAAAAAEPVEPVEFGFGSGSEPGLELGFGSGDDDGTWSWSWKTGQPRRQKRILAREGGGSVWNMTGMGLARGRCGRSRSLETLWLSWRAVKVHWSGQAVLGLGMPGPASGCKKAHRGRQRLGEARLSKARVRHGSINVPPLCCEIKKEKIHALSGRGLGESRVRMDGYKAQRMDEVTQCSAAQRRGGCTEYPTRY